MISQKKARGGTKMKKMTKEQIVAVKEEIRLVGLDPGAIEASYKQARDDERFEERYLKEKSLEGFEKNPYGYKEMTFEERLERDPQQVDDDISYAMWLEDRRVEEMHRKCLECME